MILCFRDYKTKKMRRVDSESEYFPLDEQSQIAEMIHKETGIVPQIPILGLLKGGKKDEDNKLSIA